VLEKIINVAGLINTLLFFAVVFVAAYHNAKFIHEWVEDHGNSAGFWYRSIFSVVAQFSSVDSERTRRRRGQLRLWTSIALALAGLQLLLLWL
jgi:hypothetical protein